MLPFISLLVTFFIGISNMSIGIKNITRAKSACIKYNLLLQEDLSKILEKILKINKKIKNWNSIKKALQVALAAAIVSGRLDLVSSLQKKIKFVKLKLKLLSAKQKFFILKSETIKKTRFQNFKTFIKSESVFSTQLKQPLKKALALKKVLLDKNVFLYKIQEPFKENQKITFQWMMQPFVNFYKYEKPISYQCTSTLKRRFKKWSPRLYH